MSILKDLEKGLNWPWQKISLFRERFPLSPSTARDTEGVTESSVTGTVHSGSEALHGTTCFSTSTWINLISLTGWSLQASHHRSHISLTSGWILCKSWVRVLPVFLHLDYAWLLQILFEPPKLEVVCSDNPNHPTILSIFCLLTWFSYLASWDFPITFYDMIFQL